MKVRLFLVLVFVISQPTVAFSYHETLPTHTPTPEATTSTFTPSEVEGPQITPIPTRSETGLQTNPNDRRTLLSILALVGVGGLILFLTRPK